MQNSGRLLGMCRLCMLAGMLAWWGFPLCAQTYRDCVRQAMDALAKDSLDRAETLLRQAMRIEPSQRSNALLFNHIGRIQERRGEYKDALESYTLGLNLSPHTLGLLLNRAALYMRLNRLERALADYSAVLDLNADHQEALLNRAYIYDRQRLYRQSRADYERLLKKSPSHDRALLGLAIVNDKDGRPQEAMEIMERYVQLFPSRAEGYAVKGGMELARKQYELALFDLNKAVELDDTNPEMYISRAAYHEAVNAKGAARADLETALRLGADPSEIASLLLELKH
ncbi:MAG: tetratricopeptide repeat protein [Clostridium sp.]|nr:tetratricopeptide repeat protein [Clostridium sp.]